jgi:hypothetical protein
VPQTRRGVWKIASFWLQGFGLAEQERNFVEKRLRKGSSFMFIGG